MGVLEQNNRRKGLLLGQEGNALIILISVCAILFAIINFIKIGYYLGDFDVSDYYENVLNWFLLPADLTSLSHRPWTILTYMFTHESVWYMISNVLWLWSFGYIMQDLSGNRHIAPLFLYGGVAGALFYLLTINGLPVIRQDIDSVRQIEGAGASILAIAAATTTMAPRYRIFPFLNGGIPVWILSLLFVIVDITFISDKGVGAIAAHLGGGLIGMFYAIRLKTGSDWGLWMHNGYNWFFSLFDPEKRKLSRTEMRRELFYDKGNQTPYKKTPIVTQQKIDEILDKINQHGFHFLSEDEKEYLKTASKQEL